MRYETKGINEMPKWMYWVLAVAFAWLIWTNFLKPVPDLDQLKTQQNVQIIELEKYEGSFRVFPKKIIIGEEKLNFHRSILRSVGERWRNRKCMSTLIFLKVIVGIIGKLKMSHLFH